MRINKETFSQLMELNAQDMAELIDTVALAAVYKRETYPEKMLFASLLMQRSIKILESLNCEVAVIIDHDNWDRSVEHGDSNCWRTNGETL